MYKMFQQNSSLVGAVGSFVFGMVVKIVPTEIPDMVTWGLQNLAFLATIVAACYTIKQRRRDARVKREIERRNKSGV